MNNANERGALGKRFHDLPTTPDSPDLAWEAMARHVLSPQPPEEEPDDRAPIFWWWLAGTMVLLLIGLSVWFAQENTPEEVIATPEVIAKTSGGDLGARAIPPAKNLAASQDNETASEKVVTPVNASWQRANAPKENAESLMATLPLKEREPSPAEPAMEFPATTTPESTNTPKKLYLVDGLPTLKFEPLTVAESLPHLTVERKEESEESKRSATLSFQLGGVSFASRYSEEATWLQDENNELSPEISLRYTRPLGKKLFVSTGIELRNYRFRTAFEQVDNNARIYQPGTVDTIFRNLTTGEDRVVTTDTVGGIRSLRFGNDNTVTEIGLPLLIGRKWNLGRHDFSLAAGPRVGLIVARDGRTVIESNQVTDLGTAPQFSKNLNFAGRLEVGYGFQLTPTISLLSNVGLESALSDWAETVELKQRPTVLNGRLGLSFTLK